MPGFPGAGRMSAVACRRDMTTFGFDEELSIRRS